jgi:HAD superfamily hydrolase (TIGR01549 family)
MRSKPYLLFDAGGTLVFPDPLFLSQELQKRGIEATPQQLFASSCRLTYLFDCRVQESGHLSRFWPKGYVNALLEVHGVADPVLKTIVQSVEYRHKQKSLWSFSFNWVPETLSELAIRGYRMSVISNSDGRAAQMLSDLGIAHFFECIFDSEDQGFEKPHPLAFKMALQELNLQPENALYVGDIFYIDVWGANRIGLGGLHLDPFGFYSGWPGVRLPNVSHLPHWLAQYTATREPLDLLPLRDFQLNLE